MSKHRKYQLYYFDAKARAEVIRLTFAAAGIEYEDIRFLREGWLKYREEFKPHFNAAPFLRIDETILLPQSMAIMRYIAREGGLCPTDNLEIAKCDMIVDAEAEFVPKQFSLLQERDPEKKKELEKEMTTKLMPNFMEVMQKILDENGTGFLVGDKLTYADISVFNRSDLYQAILDQFPRLKAHYERVKKNPGIKAWLEKRPNTAF